MPCLAPLFNSSLSGWHNQASVVTAIWCLVRVPQYCLNSVLFCLIVTVHVYGSCLESVFCLSLHIVNHLHLHPTPWISWRSWIRWLENAIECLEYTCDLCIFDIFVFLSNRPSSEICFTLMVVWQKMLTVDETTRNFALIAHFYLFSICFCHSCSPLLLVNIKAQTFKCDKML